MKSTRDSCINAASANSTASSTEAMNSSMSESESSESSKSKISKNLENLGCGLVIGGTQFIGRAIVEELLDMLQNRFSIETSSFSSLCILNRGKTKNPFYQKPVKQQSSSQMQAECQPSLAIEHICCDKFEDDEFVKIIGSRNWAFVLDLLLFSENQAQKLIDGLKIMNEKFNNGKIVRIIMISTDSIYEACSLDPRKDISESDSLNRISRKNKRRSTTGYQFDYGSGKLDAENCLLKHQNEFPSIIILRLPDVIGEHDNLGSFLEIVEIIEKNKSLPGRIFSNETKSSANEAIEKATGDIMTHRISIVYSRDVARLVSILLSNKSNSYPLVLNVCCDETPTVYEFYEMIYTFISNKQSESAKVEKTITVNLKKECPLPTVAFGPISNKKLRSMKELKWEPTPIFEVISKTCSWYLASHENRNETKNFADDSSSSSSSSDSE